MSFEKMDSYSFKSFMIEAWNLEFPPLKRRRKTSTDLTLSFSMFAIASACS